MSRVRGASNERLALLVFTAATMAVSIGLGLLVVQILG